MTPIALDAHDPDLAGNELREQLSSILIVEIQQRFDSGESTSPEAFADAMAHATSRAIVTAFHIGRAWQDEFNKHQREHELEHGGGANN